MLGGEGHVIGVVEFTTDSLWEVMDVEVKQRRCKYRPLWKAVVQLPCFADFFIKVNINETIT